MPKPDRSYRTSALILKRRDFGEADRLLTLLTPQFGKVSAIAKGARKPISTKTGHVELFTRVDMLINRGRDLDIVSQAEVRATYLPLREDLQRGAYASYAAELADRFTQSEEEQSAAIFDLLDATFDRLCQDEDLRRVVRYYELHLLDQVGFRPELTECVFTHEAVQPVDQFFSYAEGGAVSPAAAQHSSTLVPISVDTLKLLRFMQRSPYDHLHQLNIPHAIHQSVERLLMGYITHLLEARLQSVDFIRRVRSHLP
ncbi:MAG: DNA repair protein RecO [Chloroflexota bacterium]